MAALLRGVLGPWVTVAAKPLSVAGGLTAIGRRETTWLGMTEGS